MNPAEELKKIANALEKKAVDGPKDMPGTPSSVRRTDESDLAGYLVSMWGTEPFTGDTWDETRYYLEKFMTSHPDHKVKDLCGKLLAVSEQYVMIANQLHEALDSYR